MDIGLMLVDRAFKYLREKIHKDIAFPQLTVFILVALNQGITQPELAKILKVPQGTVSRNVIKLGDLLIQDKNGIWKDLGYNLVEQKPDIDDPRRSACYLTKKGAVVAKGLSDLVVKGAEDIAKLNYNKNR